MYQNDIGMLPPGKVAEGGKEYIFDSCPSCGRPGKFYWNPRKQEGLCFSGNCGIKVKTLESLMRLLDGEGIGQMPMLPDVGEQRVNPTPWVPQDMIPIEESHEGRAYLARRGLPLRRATECGLMVHGDWVYAPLQCVDPSLPRGYMARSIFSNDLGWMFKGEQAEKHFKSLYFFAYRYAWEASKEFKTPWLILVEGVGDLLKQPAVMSNGIAVCGSTLNEVVAAWIAERAEGVIVWGDPDRAGDQLYVRAKGELRSWGLKVFRYRTDTDPGDAPPLTYDQIVKESTR